MKVSDSRVRYASRFSAHLPCLAWTTTSEWALMALRLHSSRRLIRLLTNSRSSREVVALVQGGRLRAVPASTMAE
jgi:hypothetical protein